MSHPNKLSTDVLVVGAGPSGLTLAAELRLQGLSVIIIDREVNAEIRRTARARYGTLRGFPSFYTRDRH